MIAEAHAGFNRHELPATTPNPVYIDHRSHVTIEAADQVDLVGSLRAVWDITSDVSAYIESVHRLSELGAVVTQAVKGTSVEGFEAEWRLVDIFTVEGDVICRDEVFDETDLDAALARFEELHPQARRPENAASRIEDRFFAYFAARNWAAIAEILTDDSFVDDRRRVVNAGFWDSRDVVIANMQALVVGGAHMTWTAIATRGERLALTRICSSNRDPRHGEFGVEMLGIIEIDTDERIVGHVLFDPDDIAAAFEELDARYLAGEATAHSQTWSVISGAIAALNRHELPATTRDWVNIDHRRGTGFAPGDQIAFIRAAWDLTPDKSFYTEAVNQLSDLGAVVTWAAYGTSEKGFDAEWRGVNIMTAEGELISRCEVFDEADLDAALARFDELDPPAAP